LTQGPIFDCVLFHDGNVWRVAIDTKEDGDLTNAVLLTDYHIEHQYSTISNQDLLNYSENIFDNGNTLSIVVTAGSHGTHVAGIVGAYYKDQPELNGVAPGVQLISCKIGDSRLGTMEVMPGLVRALIAATRSKVDLINMRYIE
jgi:tripeptidyl-peptidase-2